jgi:hypothetical protein
MTVFAILSLKPISEIGESGKIMKVIQKIP